jgi:hypothetical protein
MQNANWFNCAGAFFAFFVGFVHSSTIFGISHDFFGQLFLILAALTGCF